MNKQISLSALNDELAQARTRKKEFLEQMDRIIPWGEWIVLTRLPYYEGERGNKPYELELMQRIHMLQNLYDLSDMGAKYEVIDSRAFSEFCGVESSNQVVKGLFGYRKTWFKGRRKQNVKLHMMFALANLVLADRRCLPA